MKLVFAGTPAFAARQLEAVIDSGFDIALVLTQPDRPKGRGQKLVPSSVKEVALRHNLPIEQPENLKGEAIRQTLTELKPDLIIVSAYGLIIPKWMLELPQHGCWNVHASILPRWRGAAPIHYAIWHGDKQTGITLMQLEEGLDSGPMLMQRAIDIDGQATTGALLEQLTTLGAEVLVEGLQTLDRLIPTPQDEKLVTLSPKISKEQAHLDWAQPSRALERQIRAFDPAPGCYSFYQDNRVKIFGAKILSEAMQSVPGKIAHISAEGIDVTTKDGLLQLQVIQLPGKPRQHVRDILNAKPDLFQVGQHFS